MSGLGCELWRWKLGGTCEVRQILFLPLGIFDSYVSLIQNKIFFGTLRRISDLTNLAVTSWAFSCFLSPGLWYSDLHGKIGITTAGGNLWFLLIKRQRHSFSPTTLKLFRHYSLFLLQLQLSNICFFILN